MGPHSFARTDTNLSVRKKRRQETMVGEDGPNNPGMELKLEWLEQVRVNLPAVKGRVESLAGRRTVKQQWQAAWLLRAVTCIDLTTLSGDDTFANVSRLCLKASRPVRKDLLLAMGMEDAGLTCGAVCVYPNRVAECVEALKRYKAEDIPVAAVATGFPSGQMPLPTRLQEIKMAVADGAKEIDIVINSQLALEQRWTELYEEVKQMKAACGSAHMKSILAIGAWQHDQCLQGLFGVHDGWKRLHQDEHWQGGGQCYPSSWACHVQGYQGIRRGNRVPGWFQACRGDQDCQGCRCLAGSDQGGTGGLLAEQQDVQDRSFGFAFGHREAALPLGHWKVRCRPRARHVLNQISSLEWRRRGDLGRYYISESWCCNKCVLKSKLILPLLNDAWAPQIGQHVNV